MNINTNLIFLDIDETLNSISSTIMHKYKGIAPYSFQGFNPVAVALLRKLTEMADAKIVLSSTWRLHYEDFDACRNEFEAKMEKIYGWPEFPIIGMTPVIENGCRGDEIVAWLSNHYHKNYVILDDSNDMLPEQSENFVRVDFRNGFDFGNFHDALTIFGCTGRFTNFKRAW